MTRAEKAALSKMTRKQIEALVIAQTREVTIAKEAARGAVHYVETMKREHAAKVIMDEFEMPVEKHGRLKRLLLDKADSIAEMRLMAEMYAAGYTARGALKP